MKTKDIVRAINYLAPNAEFTFENNDLETLVWLSPEINQPTVKAIVDAIPLANAAIDASKAEAKEAALAKIGLTAEELALLLA